MASLLEAVRCHSVRLVNLYLAVPQALGKSEVQKALLLAAQLGQVDVLQLLMGAGTETLENRDGGRSTTPLYVAVSHNQPEATRFLAQVGPAGSVDWQGGAGARNTPCHLAARLGYEQCLRVLVEYGACVNARDSAGCTPLILAVRFKRYGAMKVLLDSNCDVDVRDAAGRTALHYAALHATGVSLLLQAGADVNVVDKDGCTPLLLAAAEGLSNVVKALAATGKCDVNIVMPDSLRSPLHLLAHKGHAECLADLVEAGADLNAYDAQRRSALWYAVGNGRVDVVKFLLRANSQADTYRCPEDGPLAPQDACPVRLAFKKGMVKVLKLFILTGYDREHLREGLAQPDAERLFSSRDDLRHWLSHARDVMSLRCTCRKWIRHHLGYHLYHDLQQLPVPHTVKDFLFLKELDDDHGD